MKKIALLYICTGQYTVFWKDFFESFEKNFLPEFKKEYFVFTDAESLYGDHEERVHVRHMDLQPWPIPTLLKFHTFLLEEEKLKEFDYVYQPNANSVCNRVVTSEEFLPRDEEGEELIFTIHPCFYNRKPYEYVYSRNRETLAYVPYHMSTTSVFGAMNGGKAFAYLKLAHELADRTAYDLKRCTIPSSHDESYINNYLVKNQGDKRIRFLPCDYAYPAEMDIPFERVIELADKGKYIPVAEIKNLTLDERLTFSVKLKRKLKNMTAGFVMQWRIARDSLLGRKAN